MVALKIESTIEHQLPEGWAWAELEECVDILDRRRIPVSAAERKARNAGKAESELYPYYGATGQIGFIDGFLFDEELVLLGEDGAPFLDSSKEKAYLIRGKSWVNNHAHVLRALEGLLLNSFLCHYLNVFDFKDYVTGTTRLKLNQSRMRKIPVPIPPIPEQKRIVEKVAELSSQLNAGIESLKNVKAQVQRYCQAILKQAFEGKLTKDWRGKRKRKVLKPHSHTCKMGLSDQPSADGDDSPKLPEGWRWVALSKITKVSVGYVGPISRYYTTKNLGTPLLSTKNISSDGIKLDEIKYVNEAFSQEYVEKQILPDDIIIARHGYSGSAARIPNSLKKAFCLNAIIVRKSKAALSKYLEFMFNFKGTRNRLGRKKSGSVQGVVNTTVLKEFKIPLPPLTEQSELVAVIESFFSAAAKVEVAAQQSLVQSERLRQSTFREAIKGKLVSQDPTDEPAGKLLEQIREKKEKRRSEKRRKKECRLKQFGLVYNAK